MAVKMRLTRLGDKKSPFYRIVVVDSRVARDGGYVEKVGHYDPKTKDVVIDEEKAKKWLACGVQPTDTVKTLLAKKGLLEEKKTAKAAAKSAPAQAETAE